MAPGQLQTKPLVYVGVSRHSSVEVVNPLPICQRFICYTSSWKEFVSLLDVRGEYLSLEPTDRASLE